MEDKASDEEYLKEDDLKDFNNKKWDHCVETLTVSTIEEFIIILNKINNYKNRFIWRGQRKDWKLKSSFDRNAHYGELLTNEIRDKIINELFIKFIDKLVELFSLKNGPFRHLNKNDPLFLNNEFIELIWIIGQHYGLPTPILDWTLDGYKALYFAFSKESKDDKSFRVIYALDIKLLKRHVKNSIRFVSFIDVDKIDEEIRNNFLDQELKLRIDNQQSKFTRSLNGIDIEKNVIAMENTIKKDRPKYIEDKRIILTKIYIPNKLRKECLNFLESKSDPITHLKLFTDYYGAVESCKIDIRF